MSESKIFHITELTEVSSARPTGSYLPRGFDAEGFIHGSTRAQLVDTANRIFAGKEGLVVLEIEVARVQPEIRYENLEGGEILFPHIYGALDFEAVRDVHVLTLDASGQFTLPRSMAETPGEFAEWLTDTVEHASRVLREIPESTAEMSPAPNKWSPKQLVGHLVDSASNNHGRFVRAQSDPGLRHPGYDHNAWVEAGNYSEAPWEELVELWRLFNLQIARVVATTPRDALERERHDHSLDRIAWKTVPADEPVTLAYFVRDYIGHLRHHLGQIDSGLGNVMP